jgi:hypothetical protein
MRAAWFATQPCTKGSQEVYLDEGVRNGHANHRNRRKSIEFILEFLAFFPRQELRQTHRVNSGNAHVTGSG